MANSTHDSSWQPKKRFQPSGDAGSVDLDFSNDVLRLQRIEASILSLTGKQLKHVRIVTHDICRTGIRFSSFEIMPVNGLFIFHLTIQNGGLVLLGQIRRALIARTGGYTYSARVLETRKFKLGQELIPLAWLNMDVNHEGICMMEEAELGV